MRNVASTVAMAAVAAAADETLRASLFVAARRRSLPLVVAHRRLSSLVVACRRSSALVGQQPPPTRCVTLANNQKSRREHAEQKRSPPACSLNVRMTHTCTKIRRPTSSRERRSAATIFVCKRENSDSLGTLTFAANKRAPRPSARLLSPASQQRRRRRSIGARTPQRLGARESTWRSPRLRVSNVVGIALARARVRSQHEHAAACLVLSRRRANGDGRRRCRRRLLVCRSPPTSRALDARRRRFGSARCASSPAAAAINKRRPRLVAHVNERATFRSAALVQRHSGAQRKCRVAPPPSLVVI